MALEKKSAEKERLKNLLDDVVDVHRRDIKQITGGYLNESKLFNPDAKFRVPWKAASKHVDATSPRSTKLNTRCGVMKTREKSQDARMKINDNDSMQDTILHFVLGAAGSIPKLKIKEEDTDSRCSSAVSSHSDEENEVPSENVFTQELILPELMLPVTEGKETPTGFGKTFQRKFNFHTMQSSLPTKKEQYENHLKLQKDIIGNNQEDLKDDWSKIEQGLQRRLKFLQVKHRSSKQPNFYRLKAFDDCWNAVIERSHDAFTFDLRQIKDNYDMYITALMDSQQSNKDLYQKLDKLASRPVNYKNDIKEEQQKLKTLEEEAKFQLERRKRLKNKINEEEQQQDLKMSTFNVSDKSVKIIQTRQERRCDLESRVVDLHAEINKCYNEIGNILEERKDLVPKIVCQRLEQDSREMEISIQKLCKQNEFLEKSIEEKEEELEELLEETDCTERETRSLWKKINTSQLTEVSSNLQSQAS